MKNEEPDLENEINSLERLVEARLKDLNEEMAKLQELRQVLAYKRAYLKRQNESYNSA
jgi:SMC interacting uncharacterized protein involved in chromosome segregation